MTEDQLVELLDAVFVNLHYLPKVRCELFLLSRTQYELLQNHFGNLRNFHGLIVNGCIKFKTIECVLPKFQLKVERVGYFYFLHLSYQLDEENEEDEDEFYFMLVHLLLKIIPILLVVMHICSTILEPSTLAEVGCFIKKLLEAAPGILGE
ncbi:putative vacuolar protein sorting-associated protein 8 -like protein isoform X1 [Capsicum annuum]|nr:putative vacuolar protein sorting-associated protein 8 -like protein isoform X1 [Capsicum annuum]